MEIEKLPEFDNHELVSFFYDKPTGLKGYIAIHSTKLGPATGGTRYFPYKSDEEALRDALKLSRAMTYKCALAGVPYGGSKVVISADPKKPKDKKFLKSFAKVINLFNGEVSTGEDIGITQEDIDFLTKYSKFINGRSQKGGDLGPWAALGVFSAVKGALEAVFGNDEIKDRTFAIKGLGKVGFNLCKFLYEHGGKITVANRSPEKVRDAKKIFPKIKVVSINEIHKQKVDFYSPCAIGGEFNEKTIKELRCKIICGGANNQLSNPKIGEDIHRLKILYVPDYLANAGGLISVVGELRKGGYDRKWVEKKCLSIQKTAKKIIALSKKERKPTSVVADRVAESIFLKKKRTAVKPVKN